MGEIIASLGPTVMGPPHDPPYCATVRYGDEGIPTYIQVHSEVSAQIVTVYDDVTSYTLRSQRVEAMHAAVRPVEYEWSSSVRLVWGM
jgi:hypothetical protein